MKILKMAILTISISISNVAMAKPEDVYVCTNQNGEKYYDNTDSPKGQNCKKVDLPSILDLKKNTTHKKRSVSIGMTKEQVKNNLGKPANIRRTQTRAGTSESWIYPAGKVLTFKDNILEVIQD